jgi:hypothetical protein
MGDFLFYVFLFAIVALLAVAAVWIVRAYLNGQSPTSALFGPRPERRLAVVDQASVDGRRRLVLIRRDGVEHLIMTGGPVDVVIETGIEIPKVAAVPSHPEPLLERQMPTFARRLRLFGQQQEPAAERPPASATEPAAQ